MRPSSRPDHWRSVQRRGEGGAFDSEQCVQIGLPVVESSEAGAHRLGTEYWLALTAWSRGVVQFRERPDGVDLRLFRGGPALLRLGPAEVAAGEHGVTCRYPVRGGLLARRAEGALRLSQSGNDLCTLVTGFFPRVALYLLVQRRIHVAVSRRYFARLIAESRR